MTNVISFLFLYKIEINRTITTADIINTTNSTDSSVANPIFESSKKLVRKVSENIGKTNKGVRYQCEAITDLLLAVLEDK